MTAIDEKEGGPHVYVVSTLNCGEILLQRNNIREARAWARKAFRLGPRSVRSYVQPRPRCESCDSALCVCEVTP
jgi:hypothetical protein